MVTRVPSDRSARRLLLSRPTAWPIVLGVAVCLSLLAGACSDEDPIATAEAVRPTNTTATAPEPATSLPTPTTAPVETAPVTQPPVAPSTEPAPRALPTDQSGRVFALVDSVDAGAGTITIDVAQYLGGADYIRYLASDPNEWDYMSCGPDGGPYDGSQDLADCSSQGQEQTVINENTRLRTLSLAPGARFTVALGGSGEGSPVDLGTFSRYIASGATMGNTFWLTVTDGWVTDVQFQFFS